jgi:ribosomal protein L1
MDIFANFVSLTEGVKGPLVKGVTLCTTMGPPFKLDQSELEKLTQSN